MLEAKPCCPRQHHDPFALVLVVPEPFRRGVTVGDDPFDADIVSAEERLDKLVRQVLREVMEEVAERVHSEMADRNAVGCAKMCS
jgi:hypothetical protein